ncbi:MAG: hypothetical protein ACLU30_03870 [Odoribacter splanchnicus]
MGVTDLQVLQAFKKGQLELFYRRIYPGLLLYAVKMQVTGMIFWQKIAYKMLFLMPGKKRLF